MTETAFTPAPGRILVKRLKTPTQIGSIVLPSQSQGLENKGVVVAAGTPRPNDTWSCAALFTKAETEKAQLIVHFFAHAGFVLSGDLWVIDVEDVVGYEIRNSLDEPDASNAPCESSVGA